MNTEIIKQGGKVIRLVIWGFIGITAFMLIGFAAWMAFIGYMATKAM